MALNGYFTRQDFQEEGYAWSLLSGNLTADEVSALARELAERFVQLRCAHLAASWAARRNGGAALDENTALVLRASIKQTFGVPETPETPPADHLEGAVAEHVWYFLHCEIADDEHIVRVEVPALRPTGPGGDNLAVHRPPGSGLQFRLWELKKCTGATSTVSATVSKAFRQLDERAAEYLAELTTIGQELEDAELSEFYSRLVDLWILADAAAAAGVAVSTSEHLVPTTCFTSFPSRFPDFRTPNRLRGMLISVGDFAQFSRDVQEEIWRGL